MSRTQPAQQARIRIGKTGGRGAQQRGKREQSMGTCNSRFRRNARMLAAAAVGILLALVCAMQSVHAQTPQTADSEEQRRRSQAEAQERQQRQQAPGVTLRKQPSTAEGARLPLPVDTPCFPIRRIVLAVPDQLPAVIRSAGASLLPQDPFYDARRYLQQYTMQCLGHTAISELARRLNRRILAQGYSTTRVAVPEQDLSSGSLTFTLLPGVIRAIRFSDAASGGSWRSAFPARPGDLLNLRDLEQGLEQMKRVPSQEVDMEIVPGDVAGESDVLIHLRRGKPWKLIASADDGGARSTGKRQAGLTVALDNALGANDLFSAGVTSDGERQGGERGSGGANLSYALPYGYWNFALAASRYRYHQRVAGYNESFLSSGRSRDLELKVQRLFQRDQSQKNSWQFRLGKRWSNAFIDDTEITVQHRNTTFAELAWLHRHYLGDLQLDLTLANRWGVAWFNGQADDEGREPGSPTLRYSLQTLDATLLAPFTLAGRAWTYSATLRAQTSHSRLYLADQFSIGSRYTVRGFDGETTLAAERGFYLRNGIDLPLAGSGQSVYAGLDYGQVFGPSLRYQPGDRLAGATLGLRGSYSGLSYDLFAGWALLRPAGFHTRNPVFGFTLSYQY
jgi:hemolysin activation/secretion protein